jgi:hypothetical protein
LQGLEEVVNVISVVRACLDAMVMQVCRRWERKSRYQDWAAVMKAEKDWHQDEVQGGRVKANNGKHDG